VTYRILACGSRTWWDGAEIAKALRIASTGHEEVEVLHGGANGADRLAGLAARQLGLRERVFPADWSQHGRRAGVLRNLEMLDENPAVVLAFSLGTVGTQHTIDEARQRGVRVRVYGREVHQGVNA
jgi:hypothetical protein